MKLLNGYILIRVDEETTKTDAGLLLQSGAVKLPSTGTVENVAKGVKEVKEGDKVEFLRYAAIDGTTENSRLCKVEHIIGVYGKQT